MFATPDIEASSIPGGGTVLRSRTPLGDLPRNVAAHLTRWVVLAPERPLFIEPDPQRGEDRAVTYAEALATARSIGQALLDRGLGPTRGVAILSHNSIDHAL
ncbi:MAG TPA: hypothetical protein VMM13_19355, partial [Euzebya sp.]|nr:hypothetical protein [Euzebya sp.]